MKKRAIIITGPLAFRKSALANVITLNGQIGVVMDLGDVKRAGFSKPAGLARIERCPLVVMTCDRPFAVLGTTPLGKFLTDRTVETFHLALPV